MSDLIIGAGDLDFGKVAPKLYVGSFPKPGRYEMFDAIVLCAAELQPQDREYPGVKVIRAPFDDTLNPSNKEIEIAITGALETVRLLRKDKRVLVTCQMGWNRSCFVAGLAMRKNWRLDHQKIVDVLRAVRGPSALGNITFETLLRRY